MPAHTSLSTPMKRFQLIFIVGVMAALLLPFVGMAWVRNDYTTENRELAVLPGLTEEDGSPNTRFLSQLGSWFDDHFAYRNEAIAVNARLRAELFGASATSQVTIGTNGWLYYEGTLADYRGTAPLSERALFNAAHNLSLLQRFCEAQGADFLLTICPNKNSLYPENMPTNIWPADQSSNRERLASYLEEFEVSYLDMQAVLTAARPTDFAGTGLASLDSWYFAGDTHWNEPGAWTGFQALAKRLGLPISRAQTWVARTDHTGDLSAMLFGIGAQAETDWYQPGVNDGERLTGESWSYTGEQRDVAASRIATTGGGTARLVVFRDSFGISLVPYLASATASAVFTYLIPYNALEVTDLSASLVLVERAERHLDYFAQTAPIVPCPSVQLDTSGANAGLAGASTARAASTLEKGENGPLMSFSGVVAPELLTTRSHIYVGITGAQGAERVFEALTTSPPDSAADNGYTAYLSAQAIPEGRYTVTVYVETASGLRVAQSASYGV